MLRRERVEPLPIVHSPLEGAGGAVRSTWILDGGTPRRRATGSDEEVGVPLPTGPVVGTCGFSYPEWRGQFYPPELPTSEFLGFYAQVFQGVELDGTFYRPPDRSTVASWAAALPDEFAVAAKVPRAITHEARLEGEAAAAMLLVFARALEPLGDRLLAVVLQLPPSLGADEGRERLARLLGGRPKGLPVVVEVRHRSWDRPWLPELLAGVDAELALAERPDEPLWPAWDGPVNYLRLLGDWQGTPVTGRPVRDHSADLDRWARMLAGGARGERPAAAFANNRFESAGFVTAAELRRRLGQASPDPRSRWPEPPLPGLEP
jgi:uncharacterized protein YecE (DUF72 family)